VSAKRYRQLAEQLSVLNQGMAALASTIVAIVALAERESNRH